MKIFIDADGCPVVNNTIKIAKDNNIECIIVCDTSHQFNYKDVQTVTVSKGADSADFKIVNLAQKNDIVITQDYGLAAMCLSKEIKALSQNGLIFDQYNIETLLNQRYSCKKLIASGRHVKGPKKRTSKNNEEFEKALLSII